LPRGGTGYQVTWHAQMAEQKKVFQTKKPHELVSAISNGFKSILLSPVVPCQPRPLWVLRLSAPPP
jgi:hypothetical protein